MKLTVLGMNGPFPAPGGATSGYLVQTERSALVMDLGSGTLQRLTGLMAPEAADALLFSHWHYDHCSDALPLLYRLQATGRHLTVYGPEDEQSPVRAVLSGDAAVTLRTVFPGEHLTIGDFDVQVFTARHPVPAVMYRITAEGRTLCYTGDTNTVEGLADFAQGADLLLADGLFPEAIWAEAKPHLSAAHCARLAQQAAAGRLIITHLNPLIPPEQLLREAQAIFPACELAAEGRQYTV